MPSLLGGLDIGGQNSRRWKVHGECAASSLALAQRDDGSTVSVDELFHDRKPEAEASARPPFRSFRLPKAVEDMGEKVGADTFTVIGDLNLHMRTHAIETHLHMSFSRCELHGVR